MNTQSNNAAGSGCLSRLVRLARGRWLYSYSLDAETWRGCCKKLEDAIEMSFREAAEEGLEAASKIYFAHGYPMQKAECENLGLDWPCYQVDPDDAITILLPNAESIHPEAKPNDHE